MLIPAKERQTLLTTGGLFFLINQTNLCYPLQEVDPNKKGRSFTRTAFRLL